MKNSVHFYFVADDEKAPTGKRSHGQRIKAFCAESARFIGVSVLVFFVSYGILNYQSLYAAMEYKWKKSQGYESPLRKVVDEGDFVASQGKAQLLSFQSSTSGVTKIPPLAFSVYPPDMRIVIPKIDKNIPVVGVTNENLIARDWDALEKDLQGALKNGIIHYPGTALPGEGGNVVLTGHSSYYAWDAGRFKDVFALLHELTLGDRVVIFFNQRKYVYEIFDIKTVYPSQVDVLGQTRDERLTLITCTPIGTNLKRLVVTGKLIETN